MSDAANRLGEFAFRAAFLWALRAGSVTSVAQSSSC